LQETINKLNKRIEEKINKIQIYEKNLDSDSIFINDIYKYYMDDINKSEKNNETKEKINEYIHQENMKLIEILKNNEEEIKMLKEKLIKKGEVEKDIREKQKEYDKLLMSFNELKSISYTTNMRCK
jgi:hypothetical protein